MVNNVIEPPQVISAPRLAAMLALGMTASTVMVPLVSVLAPFMLVELDMSRAQLGVVVAVTPLVGGLLSPLAGRLTDRFDGFAVLRGAFLLSFGILLGVALSPSYVWLVASAGMAGLLSATGNPTTNKLISDLLPDGRRGWITGIKQTGLQVGILLAGVALPPLALAFGWRVASLSLAVLPLMGLLLARSTRRPGGPHAGATRGVATRAPIPGGWLLTTYAFLMGGTTSVLLGFLPLYAEQGLGFSPSAAGGLIATVGGVALVSRIAWGRVAERARRVSVPLAVIAIVGTAGTLLVQFASELGVLAVWIGAVLVAGTLIAWNGAGMLAVLSMAPADDVGRFSGRVQLGYFLGLGATPVAFGVLVDRMSDYTAAWSWITGLALLAIGISFVWLRTDR